MKNRIPISLCIIVKDEARQLEECLLSIKDYVDEINITVTTSDKATWDIASKYAHNIEYFKWCDDFSKARTSSFALASHNIVLWLDADDIVKHPEKLEELVWLTFSKNPSAVIMLPYYYEFNEDGLLVSEHWRERIVSKDSFVWKGRIHETFIPVKPFIAVKYDSTIVEHHHIRGQEIPKHERNLEILKLEMRDNPDDARVLYYYANTLKGLGKLKESIPIYEKYIDISGWDEEKYVACVRLADIYTELGQFDVAEDWAFKAIAVRHDYKEAYFKLGQIYYRKGDLSKCVHWLELCLRLKTPDTLVIKNPRNYDYNPLMLLSDCLFRLDRFEEALACYNKLLVFTPKLLDLQYSKSVCERAIKIKKAENAFVESITYALNNEELVKAYNLAMNAPIDLRDLPSVKSLQIKCKKIYDRLSGYEKGHRETYPEMFVGVVPDLEKEKKYQALLINLVARKDIISILDVGCFNGWMANDLSKRGWKVKGIDIGTEALDVAKAQALKENTGASFEKCNYADAGAKYFRKFDAVTCFDVLEHVLEPKKLIANLEQACKIGGWIFLNVPNGAWHKGNMDTDNADLFEHAHSYEYKDLVKLLIGKKNLEIVTLKGSGQLRSPGQSSLFIIYQNLENTGRTVEIYCGNAPESWSPKNIETGIGGSEEAVINMAKELTELGFRVIVYNSIEGDGGIFDDVAYINYEDFSFIDKHDIVIVWRNPNIFYLNIDARQKYLWLHDVPQPESYDKEIIDSIDKIFVLSKWHRDCLPNIPDDKFYITQNGIDVSLFDKYKDIPKQKHRIIYASSPDRGLENLLLIWQDVRKEVPDAELHVYYGWECYDRLRTENRHKAWKSKVLEMMNQEGITGHGRVGHEKLAADFCMAQIWAYPTAFTEISCITAMKAQAAGAYPVCTDVAALSETVQYGTKIHGSINDGNNLDLFRDALIDALKVQTDKKYESEMKEFARTYFSWKNIAKNWISLFQKEEVRK